MFRIFVFFYVCCKYVQKALNRDRARTGQGPGSDRASTSDSMFDFYFHFLNLFSVFIMLYCFLYDCDVVQCFPLSYTKINVSQCFQCFSLFVIVFYIIVSVSLVFHFFDFLYCFMYDCDFFYYFSLIFKTII